MKIRAGYVSNSSSSSFCVKVRDATKIEEEKNKMILSPDVINNLIDYGFKWIKVTKNPNFIFEKHEPTSSFDAFSSTKTIYLYYEVACNEHIVFNFLFEHKIPFMASSNYGCELWVYEGEDDCYVFENTAKKYMMCSGSKVTRENFIKNIVTREKPYRKVSIKG